MAVRLLAWQYQRMNLPVPTIQELERQAVKLVDDAHRIAFERGHNVLTIIKELISDIKKVKSHGLNYLRGWGVFSVKRSMDNLFLNRAITPKADKTRA